jgi:hypothetical protein
VWDIAPAWREQLTESGRLVLPLEMHGYTRDRLPAPRQRPSRTEVHALRVDPRPERTRPHHPGRRPPQR